MATANVPLNEFDDKFLSCPVCKGVYDDPRVLPCHHTFCTKCLEKWGKGKSTFNCPTCRQQVKLQGTDVKSLPASFYINNLLDFRAQHNNKRARASCGMCESGASIEGTCGDCRFFLCRSCITIHRKTPALKDHYIVTLHDLKNPTSKSEFTKTQYCHQHRNQHRSFYCQPCAKLVCKECITSDHQPGLHHNLQDVSKAAQNYKAVLQALVDTADALKKAKESIGQELISTTTNCHAVRKEIQENFSELRARLDKEEQEITDKLHKMEKIKKDNLAKEEKELEETLKSNADGLKFCTDILARDNDVEILTLKGVGHVQQLGEKLNAFSSSRIQQGAWQNEIRFKSDVMSTNLVKCYLSLSNGPFTVKETPVESLLTTVIFRPLEDQVLSTNPQVTVTSPRGQHTVLDTTRTSDGTFEAAWRPQTSGKHVVGVIVDKNLKALRTYGRREKKGEVRTSREGGGTTQGEGGSKEVNLYSPLIVNVGSNDPVLKIGETGSQHGHFNYPTGITVRGDRLYVADTQNKRVQVFNLSGKFCQSLPLKLLTLAVYIDGTIVGNNMRGIQKFSPSGELLYSFPQGEESGSFPWDIALLADGRVVEANSRGIFLFEADGTLVSWVGEEDVCNSPCLLHVDKEDNIFVSDSCYYDSNCHVRVFDRNLKFKHEFPHRQQPQVMTDSHGVSSNSTSMNSALVTVVRSSAVTGSKLRMYHPDGTWVSTISSDGDKIKNAHHGVAVTDDGHVFVTDTPENCVRKYRYM